MFEKVLFPVDPSRATFETAAKAIDLATSHKSHIIMLSVIQPDQPMTHDPELLSSFINKAKQQIEHAEISCEVLERQGNPAFVICDIADELNMDVIVMGINTKIGENTSSNTVERVIQLASCPVFIVP